MTSSIRIMLKKFLITQWKIIVHLKFMIYF